jgi:hypothetical protein
MSYPISITVDLAHSVQTDTTIALVEGMQVSTTRFTSPAGLMGAVTLSPVQPSGKNIQYKMGKQILQIYSIRFQAAFGLTQGQVNISGNVTNQQGTELATFSRQICDWDPY